MAATLVLLLQLALVSLVSASHHYGASATYSYKGRNADGTHRVQFRSKDTFDGCYYHHWYCSSGYCGHNALFRRSVIDQSSNSPIYNSQWCESEVVRTLDLPDDQPFQLRAASCCWVYTSHSLYHWRLLTSVDLGRRSDTGEPNRSPDIGNLPFLRVPQNCPRTYNLMAYDADGDRVRCRYGRVPNVECSACHQHSGFVLDEDSCTLRYNHAHHHYGVYGFELVVEDFPRTGITLSYDSGSQSSRGPLTLRRKRRALSHFSTSGFATATSPQSQTSIEASTAGSLGNPATLRVSTTKTTLTTATLPTTTTGTTTRAHKTSGHRTTVPGSTLPTTTTGTTTGAPKTSGHRTTVPTTTTATTTTTPVYTTPSLSKLPMHFSFLVDPPAPSCEEGLYLPRFLPPSPENGELIKAEVHKDLEIRIRAQATNATLDDLIMSGPFNISKSKTTQNEFVIRWTPTLEDLGEHYPICFAVESLGGYSWHHVFTRSVYQSELRCVLVQVVREEVITHVDCSESSMSVSIERSSVPRIDHSHLQLNDPSNTVCRIHSNRSHIFADIPLNACGTQIEEDEDHLIFRNEMTLVDDPSTLITRKHLLEVDFSCQYAKRGNVTLSFTAHRRNVTVVEKGMGTFTYAMEFFPTNRYHEMIDPNSYPLEYEIGTRIYLQLEATSSLNNTELFVESCRATPYDNANYKHTYAIISNGCKVDATVEIYPPANNKQFDFSIEAFKFIGMFDQVYISCSVVMCEAGSIGTRCSQGCINSTQSSNVNQRRKRSDAVQSGVQSGVHLVSQGPIRLRRAAEPTGSPGVNLNLNLVFIAGSLVVAVGMISGVLLFKNKQSQIKYRPLPTCEN